jgi:NAD(P)-dependent dehydrogenase (short-subunit alcohol dehydrogenase family)
MTAFPLDGRVCVVTGSSAGIGRVTAVELARRGARVLLANRSEEKTQAVLAEIAALPEAPKAEFIQLDLASLASVRTAARAILERGLLHVLINNAGVAAIRGATADGFELAFGTNHLGHFLLTELLLERLKASKPARVVTVASKAHRRATGIDFDALRSPTRTRSGVPEYAVSKLANILFSAELGRRLAGSGVTTYSLHPGVVASDLWRPVPGIFRPLIKLFMISNEEGAKTTLHCATAPELEKETGLYYDNCQVTRPNKAASDEALAKELWRRSEEWVAK